MTAQQKNWLKDNWQPVSSILIFMFACGGFYFKTEAYDSRLVKVENAQTLVTSQQNQYDIKQAVILEKIDNINKNIDRISRGGR